MLTDVGDELEDIAVGRDADQELELIVGGVQPEAGDEDGKNDGTHGIDPPLELASADGGHDTEAVDEEIVAVVLP